MATNPSTEPTNQDDNKRSPGRFSCGMMLSITETTRVCPFFLMARQTVPKQGAMNGIQYFTMTRSGQSFLISLPTDSQFSGLTELSFTFIFRPSGASSVENWVFQGKSTEGYWRLKV